MKVLVATHRTRGDAPGDYCHTDDGEIVRLWDCPCAQQCELFSGVETRRGTTTAMVVERADLDPSTLAGLLRQDLVLGGWAEAVTEEELTDWIASDVAITVAWVDRLPVGTVVERAGFGAMRVRSWPDGARVSYPRDSMSA